MPRQHFKEKSGLTVKGLTGPFRMDSTSLALPALRLKTPFTDLALTFRMDMNAFSTDLPADSTGAFTAIMRGSIGAHDLLSLASPYLPKNILNVWPRVPLVVNGRVGGNLHQLHINNMYLAMPGILKLDAGGFLDNVTVPAALRADMNVTARTGNLAFISSLLPKSVTSTVNIPQDIAFRGHVKMDGQQIASRFVASQGGGFHRWQRRSRYETHGLPRQPEGAPLAYCPFPQASAHPSLHGNDRGTWLRHRPFLTPHAAACRC